MMQLQVLLVAGTHGNEINGIWLFDEWNKSSFLINTHGIKTCKVIGNPEAKKAGKRYIHNDLNRSFQEESFLSLNYSNCESARASELVDLYGDAGENPCQIALDFHTTTASMGSCLVVYGRRNADLALASLIQNQLGLPIYLHESDQKQTGFLVESWPCGLVVEIGPIGQGLLNSRIISQTKLILETLMEQIHKVLKKNDELFCKLNGEIIRFEEDEPYIPVFINEAAYVEKNIAMSFTKKELWNFKKEWKQSLIDLVHQK